MNSTLKNFFKEEQKRVFEPGPYFTQRVMARLAEGKAAYLPGFWEVLPKATRPVLALALAIMFAVLAVQILAPVEPARGAFEVYVGQDLSARERMLFIDPQLPANVQFEEWTLLEPTP